MTLSPWKPSPGYLNTASFGIPCPASAEAGHRIMSAWASGKLLFAEWLEEALSVRFSIARLLSTSAANIALGTSSSLMLHSVAASLPNGAQVIVPGDEHNSNIIPYLNQAHRGVRVQVVPLSDLPTRITPGTTLVSCSAVQSLSGEVVDLQSIRQATRGVGALFCLDATQACGWLPLSANAADIIVCSMFKWLCGPIGGAFLAMDPEAARRLRPATPSWVSRVDAFAAAYGTDFVLAPAASRFDLIPNLVSMIGSKHNIDAIMGLGVDVINRHNVSLANRLRCGLDMLPSNSAIVALPWQGAAQKLAASGVVASEWRGKLRLSFHLGNSEEDVKAALEVLRPLRASR